MLKVSIVALSFSLVACGLGETTDPVEQVSQGSSIESVGSPTVDTQGTGASSSETSATDTNASASTDTDTTSTADTSSDTTASTVTENPNVIVVTTETASPLTPVGTQTPVVNQTPVTAPAPPLPWHEELLGEAGVTGSWYCGSILDSQISAGNNPVNWEEALIVDWTLPVLEMKFNTDRTVSSGPVLGTNIFGTYWYQTNNNGKNVTIQWSGGGYIEFYFNEQNTEQMMGGGLFCSRFYPESA